MQACIYRIQYSIESVISGSLKALFNQSPGLSSAHVATNFEYKKAELGYKKAIPSNLKYFGCKIKFKKLKKNFTFYKCKLYKCRCGFPQFNVLSESAVHVSCTALLFSQSYKLSTAHVTTNFEYKNAGYRKTITLNGRCKI